MPVTKVKVNGEWIPAMPVGGGGEGDMTKAVYDTNDDGVVNAADQATKDGSGNVITSTYAVKATTLSGYGITDAKIENGSIILGGNSITPLTSFTETDPVFTASAAYGISSSDISNWNSKADSATTLSGYGITDASISNRTITLGSNTITVPENMVILSYGNSTWNDFISVYNTNRVVYCRASSNSNPASGSQTRLAFMAYVNNGDSPTEVEFQYYRSVSSHSASQQGDQVYVYKLTSSGTWTVTTREASSKIAVTSPVSSSYSSGTITLSLADAYGDTQNPYGTKTANYVLAGPTSGNASAPTFRALVANDIPDLSGTYATKATTLSGYGIADAYISNGTITLGSNTITPVTSSALADYIASDEIGKVYVSDTEPSNTSNYDIWIDTSTTLQNANGVMV